MNNTFWSQEDNWNLQSNKSAAELSKLKDELNELKESKMADARNAESRNQELKRNILEMKDKLTVENKQLGN